MQTSNRERGRVRGHTPEQLDHHQYFDRKQAGRLVGMTDFFLYRLATARILLKVAIIYIVHEFLADGANLLWKGGTEHHHLLGVGCSSEHFLYITAHVCRNDNKGTWSIM